jgi:hypothetical protein
MSLADEENDRTFSELDREVHLDKPKGVADIDVSAFTKPKDNRDDLETITQFLDGILLASQPAPAVTFEQEKQRILREQEDEPTQWTEDLIAATIMSCKRISYCPLCGHTFKLPMGGVAPNCAGYGEENRHPLIQPLIMVPSNNMLESGQPIDPLKLLQKKGLSLHD